MVRSDILIVGAGAAGLMAARELAITGRKVIVLEAKHRIGGRIYPIEGIGYPEATEGGAEFVHGDLPVTRMLLQEAGINWYESGGQIWRSDKSGIMKQGFVVKDWNLLIERLMQQTKDMSIADFLQENFAEEKYKELRNSVTNFVEGYDAADTHLANIFALREEWSIEGELRQYHPEGGYGVLTSYLEKECIEAGVEIHLSTQVQTIGWERDRVEVFTTEHEIFVADKVIVTVSLGVLRAGIHNGGISFTPTLPAQIAAAHDIGFGAVIKFLAMFKDPFWENYITSKGNKINMNEMGFVFADTEIPTWWTQFPLRSSLLTGWLAGPKAEQNKGADIIELKSKAIHSLCDVFKLTEEEIQNKLLYIEVINWSEDPYTRGAYAYSTLETANARAVLTTPEADTIYFSGEALYNGAAIGTVEAAFSSGLHVAHQIIDSVYG